jgi:hypothetical protein
MGGLHGVEQDQKFKIAYGTIHSRRGRFTIGALQTQLVLQQERNTILTYILHIQNTTME